MKKIFIFIIASCMIMGLSITSLAVSETYLYGSKEFYKFELPYNDLSYAIIHSNTLHNKWYVTFSENPFTFYSDSFLSNGAHTIEFTVPTGTYLETYDITTSGLSNKQAFNQNGGTFSAKSFLWTSHDIYDADGVLKLEGDPNFMVAPPLQTILLKVMGEQLKATVPEIHGTMRILVVCGVGCLALLVGLKLFGKRSLLFLRR